MTYARGYEEELLDRPVRRRMEVPGTPRPGSEQARTTEGPRRPRDTRCGLLRAKEWLSLAVVAPRLPALGDRLSTGGSGGGARMEPSSTSTPRYANECASVLGGTRFRAQVLPTPSPRRPQGSAEKSVATTATRRCAAGSVTFWWTPKGWSSRPRSTERQGPRPGRPEAAAGFGAERALAPFAPVGGRRLPGQGRTLGQGGDGFERGGGAQAPQAGA